MRTLLGSWTRWALLGTFLTGLAAGEALGAEPKDQLKGTVERVLAILKDPALKGEAKTKDRRDLLRSTISKRFDFREMALRSLARHWRTRSAKEQEEFVQIFSDLLERSYVSRIEGYTDEEIVYPEERVEDNFAEVRSKIIPKSGRDIPIEYRLHKTGTGWLVYDVVIEGVSLISNYRSQFNRIISQQSYAELLKRMREKQIEEAGN